MDPYNAGPLDPLPDELAPDAAQRKPWQKVPPQPDVASSSGDASGADGLIDAGLEGVSAGADLLGGVADAAGGALEAAGEVAGGMLEGLGGCADGCSGCSLALLLALTAFAGTAAALFR